MTSPTYQRQNFPDRIVLEPSTPADSCIIWLHGLGASGDDFVPVLPHLLQALNTTQPPVLRAIYPHAPQQPVTINGGMVMPSWYDLLATSPRRQIDGQQLSDSVQRIHTLIDQQIAAGIDSRRILLAGFSQGGAVAYETAFSYPQPLAGLMALSTYIARPLQINAANQHLPVLIAHGDYDAVVSPELGEEASRWLAQSGINAESHRYPMAHEVCLQEIEDYGRFGGRCLSTRV
ncbi:alpha/beta fold hydrolase [Thalassolituus sp. ST750PaO-4]|uniref:alpha/beta hydrolase n=1 Tax=Thalassolituus sp. ST750PaO-4 TaxID=2742965 RepID=UPI001CE29A47|nr:alpha/beta fold hydrolase [Thalassolituus sp. ST750PaO-4]MCA6058471.1 alpha/beta fold hydrolase [Thalassolituus sp. ST750PaO-4]